jgi:hypothetical protein
MMNGTKNSDSSIVPAKPTNIHARTSVPGRLGKATSRTPSMYVDEKSDEAIVPAKRLNKGRQLPAEVVEGEASPKGNSR